MKQSKAHEFIIKHRAKLTKYGLPVAIVVVVLLLIRKILSVGILTYGDIPLFDIHSSSVNAFYVWGGEQLGTNVRQGLNTIRDILIYAVSWSNEAFYFIKYILPVILVPLTYYVLLRKIRVTNPAVLFIGSLFPLFTPVVYGDFLAGQTFWIYITLPWALYFTLKIYLHKVYTLKNVLLLSLALTVSLGMLPPIIVPLAIVMALIIAISFFINSYWRSKGDLLRFFVASAAIGVCFLLFSLPYLFAASSGQEAYTPASLFADYYHNYASTELLNTLRLAGNNGNGQATLGYNFGLSSNAAGYVLLGFIAAGAIFVKKSKNIIRNKLFICLLVTLLLLLGFMHLMTVSPEFGVKVFESQWIVSTIRNPSKLYVILLPIFTLLLCLALQAVLKQYHFKLYKIGVVCLAIASITAYGWPTLGGDLGLFNSDQKKLSDYKPQPLVNELNTKFKDIRAERSLLLPSTHADELTYEKITPGFRTLGLQGSLPSTSKYVQNLSEALNAKNRYFFNYISNAGIKNVILKKDPSAYENARFSLLSLRIGPAETAEFLSSGLKLESETKDYYYFKNTNANELVYAPDHIVGIRNDNDLNLKSGFFKEKVAVLDDTAKDFSSLTEQYSTESAFNKELKIDNGLAKIYNPEIIVANISSIDNASKLLIEILHPLTNRPQKTIEVPIQPDASILRIGTTNYTFNTIKKRITLKSGYSNAEILKATRLNINASDPSFEQSFSVSDTTRRKPGEPAIYGKASKDATHKKTSLLVGSSNHGAAAVRLLPLGAKSGSYLLRFDHKNLRGNSGSFGVYEGKNDLAYASGRLSDSGEWSTVQTFFSANTKSADLYLYSSAIGNETSENLYDNIQLYNLEKQSDAKLKVSPYEPEYKLRDYSPPKDIVPNGINLLPNGGFEDKSIWGKVGDASPNQAGDAKIETSQGSEPYSGKHSVELKSSNHTAYISAGVRDFEPNSIYRVSFYYKNKKGRQPSFSIWQDGAGVSAPSGQLTKAKEWTYFETTFLPDPKAKGLSMYFYSPASSSETINLFDDVRIEKSSLISKYLRKISDPAEKPGSIVKDFKRINEASFTVAAKPGKGLVILNESYHKGWKAIAKQGDKSITVADANHIMVNGFANGWWVDSSKLFGGGDYTISLEYAPQKSFTANLALGLTLISGAIITIIILSVRNRKREVYARKI
ncbi:MAG TPA: carbohydrate binding domain-containing protein [Candidatus Saccharimonadales bacterium]